MINQSINQSMHGLGVQRNSLENNNEIPTILLLVIILLIHSINGINNGYNRISLIG